MTKLDQLIKDLCPNGVEYKTLGEVLFSINTGLNPRQNFKLNPADATGFYVTVKEMASGKIIFSDKTDRINKDAIKVIQIRSNLEQDDVLLSGIGTIGKVALVDCPTDNWNCSESVFVLKPKKDTIKPKFLMYILQSQPIQDIFHKTSVGSTLRGIRKDTLYTLKVPIPPLAVQCEIVRILDSFALLTAELTAELTARKKQYEYYLNKLLNSQYPSKALGEIGTFIRGNGLQKKDFVESGVGCIHYGQIYTYYGTFADKTKTFVSTELSKTLKKAHKGDLIIACTSENVEDVGKAVAWLGDEDICIGGHSYIFRHNQNPKYMSYLFQTEMFFSQKRKKSQGVKVIDLSDKAMSKFQFPLPPIEVQQEIVRILDRFETLCNDISAGLPAEIKARQQQYEYYRDRLLKFQMRTTAENLI